MLYRVVDAIAIPCGKYVLYPERSQTRRDRPTELCAKIDVEQGKIRCFDVNQSKRLGDVTRDDHTLRPQRDEDILEVERNHHIVFNGKDETGQARRRFEAWRGDRCCRLGRIADDNVRRRQDEPGFKS